LSEDGRIAVTTHGEDIVRVWNTKTCKCIKIFRIPMHFAAIKAIGNPKRIVFFLASDRVKVFDCTSSKFIKQFNRFGYLINQIVLSKDARLLGIADEGDIYIQDTINN